MSTATEPRDPGLLNSEPALAKARVSTEEAFRFCEQLARSHYENFNVGGWITPKDKLPHVYAIYAWCRMVDDLGDEEIPLSGGTFTQAAQASGFYLRESRSERLDWWESELDQTYRGNPAHPISIAVKHTVSQFRIPRDPFLRLIHANRLDQGAGRFATMDDVLDYCTYSANPVGHLYMYLFGYDDPERQRLSDKTCTALQLTNFWQDVSRDYHDRDRIYLPEQDMERFGVCEQDIAAGTTTPQLRELLRYECDAAYRLFQDGAPLIKLLEPQARLPVALFTRGGVAILDAIRRQNYDVLERRPSLSKRRKAWLLLSAWAGNRIGIGYGLPTR